jgi:hypothetical protein
MAGKMDDRIFCNDLDLYRYSIVVISNQKLSKDLQEWKRKIHLIAASVSQSFLCDSTHSA